MRTLSNWFKYADLLVSNTETCRNKNRYEHDDSWLTKQHISLTPRKSGHTFAYLFITLSIHQLQLSHSIA